MTVGELIELLKTLPPERQVATQDFYGDLRKITGVWTPVLPDVVQLTTDEA
jgi:hypothetical protein